MGIIDGVRSKVSNAAEEVKKRFQSEASKTEKSAEASKVCRSREAASAKNSEAVKADYDGSAFSSKAQAVADNAAAVGAAAAGKNESFSIAESCGKDTQLMAKQMVKEGICSEDELIILVCDDAGAEVSVTPGEDEGSLVVSINGEITNLTSEEAERLIISGGAGNDNIFIDDRVKANLHIAGEDGDDTIIGGGGRDTIYGGEGNDTIAGGSGDDYIDGGKGDDIVYGDQKQAAQKLEDAGKIEHKDGNDTIFGGDGIDYIEGGGGNDNIHGGKDMDIIYAGSGNDAVYGDGGDDYLNGGAGDDMLDGGFGKDSLFGLSGNDTLKGGWGTDVLVGGKGIDNADGGMGKDRIVTGSSKANADNIAENWIDEIETVEPMDVPENIYADGSLVKDGEEYRRDLTMSDSFAERVNDDLEAMASLQYGQDLFAAIKDSGHKVVIHQLDNCDNGGCAPYDQNASIIQDDGSNGEGSDSMIFYNPSYTHQPGRVSEWAVKPSMLVMEHELNHAYNNATGTKDYSYVTEHSRNAGGGEWTGRACERQAVGLETEGVKSNPEFAQENSWREYLNLPKRTSYSGYEGNVTHS